MNLVDFYSRKVDFNKSKKNLVKNNNTVYFVDNPLEQYDSGFDEGMDNLKGIVISENLTCTQVVVNKGGNITIINDKGTTVLEGKPTWFGASVFKQYVDHDNGLLLEIQEQFHKGITYTDVKVLGSYCYLNNGDNEPIDIKKLDKSDFKSTFNNFTSIGECDIYELNSEIVFLLEGVPVECISKKELWSY